MLNKFFCTLFAIFTVFLTSEKALAYPVTHSDKYWKNWYFDDGQVAHGYGQPFLSASTKNIQLYFENVGSRDRGIDVETRNCLLRTWKSCPHSKVVVIFSDGERINLHKSEPSSCSWLYGTTYHNNYVSDTHHPDEEHHIYDKLIIKGQRPIAIDYDNHHEAIDTVNFDQAMELFKKSTDPRKFPKLYDRKDALDTRIIFDDPYH